MLNTFFTYLKQRIHLFVFFLSLTSILFILIKIISIDIIGGIQNIVISSFFFSAAINLSTIFTILFLPTYPLFFIIFKEKTFNHLEKLSLTIISNLVFYILSGYIGYFLGFPMIAFFFFLALIVLYFSLISFIIILEHREKKYFFLRPKKGAKMNGEMRRDLVLFKKFKNLITKNRNFIFIIIFLSLVCILNFIRFSYWFGRDAMYHIFVARLITDMNFLPLEEYFGAVGLQLFSAVIHFFSGIDLVHIPRYFLFYTIFVSALIFYNLLMRIFKNKNLALFGIFILEFSSIGFSYTMYQFWPTNLAVIQCLTIFFLLYVRIQNLIKLERPAKREILSNTLFNYVLIILIFISSLFSHSLNTIILILSITFIYLIYFIKDFRRGFDFLILLALLGIFLGLSTIGLSEHFFLLQGITLQWYILLFVGIGGVIVLWWFQKSIIFTRGRFNLVITGKKRQFYKKIEDKLILPISLAFIPVFMVIFILLNILLLDINISKGIVGLEAFLFILFAVWGLYLFQLKPRGKPLFLWFIGLGLIFLGAFYTDVFITEGFWSGRILLLFSSLIGIGFISYLYKLLKTKSFDSIKVKAFIFLIVGFSFFAHFYDELTDVDNIEYNLMNREVSSLSWLSTRSHDKNVYIFEFGLQSVLMYFDYPFEAGNTSLSHNDIHYFLYNYFALVPPEEHINDSGVNILQALKLYYNTDVIIILDDNYEVMSGWEAYGRLTEEEMNAYYNMNYLNKFFSSKSESGVEVPYFWVI